MKPVRENNKFMKIMWMHNKESSSHIITENETTGMILENVFKNLKYNKHAKLQTYWDVCN